ncbi:MULTISPECIES: MFS transporter [unclassified Streptomyces]|uniref:MFS transporter n=1 Tax=unclassified Streptomyces TaxID=2593676 RepID=UPI002948C017|nr:MULTISPECIES: MFS transporter [unclassified Streptomyces]
MSGPPASRSGRSRLADRLGVPRLSGNGRIVAATALDSFGVGMFIPLNFLFFLLTTDLTVQQVGYGTSLATLLSVPVAPLAGSAVDRWGPKASLVANNILATGGYLCYLLVDSQVSLVAVLFVVLCAERMYWASWPAFVADMAQGEELDRWYAFTAAGKNASVGLGGAAGGALLASGWSGAAVLIVLLNAVTSAVTALLFAFPGRRVSVSAALTGAAGGAGEPEDGRGTGGGDGSRGGDGSGSGSGGSGREADGAGGWRSLLGDRTVFLLIGAQTVFVFAWLVPTTVLPVYLVEVRGLPAWLPSTALTLNALLIVVAQSTLTARLAMVRRSRVIVRGAGLMLGTVALLALLPVAGEGAGVGLVYVAVVLFTFGQMTATPAMTAVSATVAPRRARGRYLSVVNLTWTVSAITGPALVGALVERHTPVLWAVLAALTALGGLGYHLAGRMAPERLGAPRAKPATAGAVE